MAYALCDCEEPIDVGPPSLADLVIGELRCDECGYVYPLDEWSIRAGFDELEETIGKLK